MGAIGLCLASSAASAQDRLGGHFGVVFPLVTHANGSTTDIGEDFKIGFPMGITVKTSDRYAFDLEVVPVLDPRRFVFACGELLFDPARVAALRERQDAYARRVAELPRGAERFRAVLASAARD